MNENVQTSSKFLKFLQFPLIKILLGFFILITAASIAQILTQPLMQNKAVWANLLAVCLTAGVVGLAYYGFVRWIERRAVSELAISPLLAEVFAGMLLGAALFSITIAILWLLGYYKVSGSNDWTALIPWLVVSILSSVVEELMFRGLLFRIVEESLGTWIALTISALFFGLAHLANPNATLWGAFAIVVEAGILLAAAYAYTRRLWLPIGIHFAWNFTQGAIFSVAVSGNSAQGLLQSSLNGPDLLTGGAFGVEGSIFAVFVCLTAGATLLWAARKIGNFIQPFWQRGKK